MMYYNRRKKFNKILIINSVMMYFVIICTLRKVYKTYISNMYEFKNLTAYICIHMAVLAVGDGVAVASNFSHFG